MEDLFATLNENNSWEESFERVRAHIEALPEDKLVPVNVDILGATRTALGALPKIAVHRAEIEATVKNFDFEAFDRLADYARAAAFAHSKLQATVVAPDRIRAMADHLSELRDLYSTDVKALVRRGLLDDAATRAYRGTIGYANVIADVTLLVAVLKDNWSKIEGKCAIARHELDRAADLAAHLHEALGARQETVSGSSEAARLRDRAFSLFARTYDAARRAVTFVRGEAGDADRIAPSLYKGRGGKKRGVDEETETLPGIGPEAAPAEGRAA